jgi:hypothetical protein
LITRIFFKLIQKKDLRKDLRKIRKNLFSSLAIKKVWIPIQILLEIKKQKIVCDIWMQGKFSLEIIYKK